MATGFPVLAFAPMSARDFAWTRRCWELRRSLAAKMVMGASLAMMIFIAVYPLGFDARIRMARYLYENFPDEFVGYSIGIPFGYYPMYRVPRFELHPLHDFNALGAILGTHPVYLISDEPSIAGALPPGVRATLLYSELPLAYDPMVAVIATRVMRVYNAANKAGMLPYLSWATLFRIERIPNVAHGSREPDGS